MNTLRKYLLALIAFALSAPGLAHADAFASAILEVSNFRLLRADGTAFSGADFPTLSGGSDANVRVGLNGTVDAGSDFVPIPVSGPDLAHRCLGAPCPARPENDFSRFAGVPLPGNFAHGDQRLAGSAIDVGGVPAGALAQTRADTAIGTGASAEASSDTGASVTFSLAEDASMTVDFDYMTSLELLVTPVGGMAAAASTGWSFALANLTLGELVYYLTPDDMNAFIWRDMPGTAEFIRSGHINDTFALTGGDLYQLTIRQVALVSTTEREVPEPATLALVAIGCAAAAAVRRRRA